MLSITEREILAKIGGKVKNVENDFLTEMYSKDSPLSKTVDFLSKCCIFIHYQLKIHDGNCLKENGHFKIFLKINFFNSTTSNAHNSAKNRARDLLLVLLCREFYLVWPPGLNSKPTTWYLFIWTHTYNLILDSLLPISEILTHQNLQIYWDFSPCLYDRMMRWRQKLETPQKRRPVGLLPPFIQPYSIFTLRNLFPF